MSYYICVMSREVAFDWSSLLFITQADLFFWKSGYKFGGKKWKGASRKIMEENGEDVSSLGKDLFSVIGKLQGMESLHLFSHDWVVLGMVFEVDVGL